MCNVLCTTLCGWIGGKGRDTDVQIICTLDDDATLYIDTTKPLLIVGLNLLILGVGVGFLGHGGLGVWFLNDLDSCAKQLSLKITFIV